MARVKVPEEGTAVCASCRTPRGNVRRGWAPILRGADLVGYTCPECPEVTEPIRRWESERYGVRWRAVVDVAPLDPSDPHGRRRIGSRKQVTETLGTLAAAREWVAEAEATVRSGQGYLRVESETVEALCVRWLASRRDIRPVTVDGYKNALAAVRRRIGSRKLTEVTVADVEALTAWLSAEGGRNGQPLGPRAVRAALVALGQAFDMAAREGTLPRNVARLARRPRVRKRVGRDLEHWQPAELMRFREHADADPLAGAWRLTLCGLTRADILGLRWSDVDLVAGVASVSQGRVPLNHGDHTDEPKSAQRVRAVPVEAIPPGTVALLKRMSTAQAKEQLAAGTAYSNSGYLVVDALGHPVRPEWYSDRFRALCSEADVRRITLHSVRHSLAFWLHQIGVAPADAAALLGHTVEVHLSTYLPHSGAAGITSAAEALGRAAAAE